MTQQAHKRSIVVNTRCLRGAHFAGVQRYAQELVNRWDGTVDSVGPERAISGLRGHAWEQMVLPAKVGDRLLFCPSSTGPLAVKRQVVTIHDTASFDVPWSSSRAFSSWYRTLHPLLARRVERVITISEFAKQRILFHLGIPSDKVVAIPNGVGLERFHPQPAIQLQGVPEALGLPSHRYIVSVGTPHPYKNHRRLLEAWARVQGKLSPDVWLVLVGAQGPKRVFRQAEMGDLPEKVFMAGHVSDAQLPAVYAGAIACVQVSLYEGFGLPALEAMACGTPVLASNTTAFPEVVGDAGMTVDPLDVDAISRGIERLVSDDGLREDLRQRGLERASHFSWDETARKTWEVLSEASG